MNEKRFAQHLERIAAEEIPDSMNKWPMIQAKLPIRRSRAYYIPHVLRGVAAMVVIALTGLIGYAFSQGPSSDPGLDYVDEMGWQQPLNLTESHEGVAITLLEGYADANRIVLWLSADVGDLPEVLYTLEPTLSYANGDALNAAFGLELLGEKDAKVREFLISFDLDEPLTDDQPLDLRLTIDAGDLDVIAVPDDVTLEPGPVPPEYMVDVPRFTPFVFTFQLDVHEALVVNPQQSVTANGLTMTLEQVTLAPSQIALSLCFDLPDNRDWQPVVQLDVDGVAGSLLGFYLTERPDLSETRRCADYDVSARVTPESQVLTVTVDSMQTSASFAPESLARAQEQLAEQGIEIEFKSGEGFLDWDVISLPDGMSEEVVAGYVWPALCEKFEGQWSFTVTLSDGD